jgi:hypothetical protein
MGRIGSEPRSVTLVSSVPDPTTRSEQHKNQRSAECNDEEIEIHGADSIMNRK